MFRKTSVDRRQVFFRPLERSLGEQSAQVETLARDLPRVFFLREDGCDKCFCTAAKTALCRRAWCFDAHFCERKCQTVDCIVYDSRLLARSSGSYLFNAIATFSRALHFGQCIVSTLPSVVNLWARALANSVAIKSKPVYRVGCTVRKERRLAARDLV